MRLDYNTQGCAEVKSDDREMGVRELIFGMLSFMPDFRLTLNFFLIVIADASISLM